MRISDTGPGRARALPETGAPQGRLAAALAAQPWDADEYRPSLRKRAANLGRSLSLAASGIFGGHPIDDTGGLHKPYQRVLHRLFPGELAMAGFSKWQPNPAGDIIPSGPLRRPVDARAWMPLVHFAAGERFYPTDPGFDRDARVANNPDTYRPGKTDGSQEPTVFVHARERGEYTVVAYDLYFADNHYVNYHAHDWEGFMVYLCPDAQGRLRPAYLQTAWHNHKTLTPWPELQVDATGRPIVLVDKGGHGTRPLKRGQSLPSGRTLHPNGFWRERHGITGTSVHLRGDTPLLLGTEPVLPLADGRDPRQVTYPGSNWILGFIKLNTKGIRTGPQGWSDWENPPHPMAFSPSRRD